MAQKVEIFFHGTRRLVFMNGQRVCQVLSVDTLRDNGSLAGVVTISFVASDIVEREVRKDRFNELMECVHPSERVVPAPGSDWLRGNGFAAEARECAKQASQAADEAAWRHEVLKHLRSIDQALTNVTEGGNAMRVTAL